MELDSAKQDIRNLFEQAVKLSDAEWKIFEDKLSYVEVRKGDFFISEGQVEFYMNFLIEGVTRTYYLSKGQEYTLAINLPKSAFNSYTSFILRQPSVLSIEAITHSRAFRISYNDLEEVYNTLDSADRIGRKMVEMKYAEREQKELFLQTKSSEEFYDFLVSQNAELIQQVPQKYIASYLGITPESLSRIRNGIKSQR